MAELDDRRVIACNYTEGTKVCKKGARAYVVLTNPGGGNDRIEILARSRGGRWIEKWENIRRLQNFRLTTIPPEHPLYSNPQLRDDTGRVVALLERARAHFVDGADHNAPLQWTRAGFECRETIDVGLHTPPAVRINAVGAPDVLFYVSLETYYEFDADDAGFAAWAEAMLDFYRTGAFG